MKKTEKDIQMLGPQVVLEGNLVFEGTLYMNGHVKGSIESRTGEIVVGEDAVIHADVFVRVATIKGEIKGTVRAAERIELHPPGRVNGGINAPVVQIDAGAIFEGKCTIKPREDAATPTDRVLPANVGKKSKTDESPPEVKRAGTTKTKPEHAAS